jgi:uncharacterized protein YggU (UPF0235/DUF167 family)
MVSVNAMRNYTGTGIASEPAMPVRMLRIKVKPNARAASLVEQADGSWVASVRALPVDGKANAELVALVADHFSCPRRAVSIRSGAGGRMKLVEVDIAE